MSNKENFDYLLTLKFRNVIFDTCRVLINDMTPVIQELKLFIKNILLSPTEGDSKIIYRIDSIELYKETKSNIVKEFKWSLNTNQDTEIEVVELTLDNVKSIFKEEKKAFIKLLKDEGIDFPPTMYGLVFVCFSKLITEYLNQTDLIEKENVYDILTIDNNGENNIIY